MDSSLSNRDELNPYAAPGVTELKSDEPASPDAQVSFSGEVTEAHLAKTFAIAIGPTVAALCFYLLGISACAGLLYELFGISIPIVILAVGSITAIALVALTLAAVKPKVRRLIRYRPWLLGKVHGTFSSAFTTIWHRDVGIQLVSHDLSRHVNKSGYVMRANREPFAIVPSICFFQEDWHQVLDTLELKQLGYLHLNPPPSGAHACALSIDRLGFLDTRLRGFRCRLTEGLGTWFVAMIVTGVLWRLMSDQTPTWLYFPTIPCVVFAFYLSRISFWTWHTRRQFANDHRGYLGLAKEETKRSVHWFTDDTVFWSDGLMWIQMPVRFITRVRVEFSVIEFYARGMEFRFHREGFQNHEAWLAASESARKMKARLRAGLSS